MRPRREFLKELEVSSPNEEKLQEIIREARPYFVDNGPIGSNTMLLKLPKATVGHQTNTTRRRWPSNYLSKMPTVAVPEYALEVATQTHPPKHGRIGRGRTHSYVPYSRQLSGWSRTHMVTNI